MNIDTVSSSTKGLYTCVRQLTLERPISSKLLIENRGLDPFCYDVTSKLFFSIEECLRIKSFHLIINFIVYSRQSLRLSIVLRRKRMELHVLRTL